MKATKSGMLSGLFVGSIATPPELGREGRKKKKGRLEAPIDIVLPDEARLLYRQS